MFFLTLIVAFGLLSIPKKTRYVCAVLCGLNVFLLFLTTLCDKNGELLYYLRAIVSTIAVVILCNKLTIHSCYQAVIQLLILCAYLALAYDVTQGRHMLIYNNYETVIYVLVACQFIGVFTALRLVDNDHLQRRLRRRFYFSGN